MPKLSVGRVSRGIQKGEEVVLAGAMLLVAALTIANVFSRMVYESLAFAEELSKFLIVVVTFVGLSYAASQGRHIRMTAIYDQLGAGKRKTLMVVISATTAFLMFLLACFAVRYVGTVRALGTASPVLGVPLWIVYCAAPLGLALAGVQYSLAVAANLKRSAVYLSWSQSDEYDPERPGSVGAISGMGSAWGAASGLGSAAPTAVEPVTPTKDRIDALPPAPPERDDGGGEAGEEGAP